MARINMIKPKTILSARMINSKGNILSSNMINHYCIAIDFKLTELLSSISKIIFKNFIECSLFVLYYCLNKNESYIGQKSC